MRSKLILINFQKNYNQNTCWLREKEFKPKDVKENPVVKDPCHLTGKFRVLAHNNCNLNTREARTSSVPILVQNVSGYDCHLIFEKLVNIATEKKTLKEMKMISYQNRQKILYLLKKDV